MRKTVEVITTLLIVIALLCSIQAIIVTKANPYPHPLSPLQVHSPTPNPYVSLTHSVEVSFDYRVAKDQVQVDHFSYNLDNVANASLTYSLSDYSYGSYNYSIYSVRKILENLSNGAHSITLYVQFLNGTVKDFWRVSIIVDPSYQTPVPQMISPINQTTYQDQDVQVVFTVNSTFVGNSLYLLDSDSSWKGLNGNGTLHNLSDGQHVLKLVMYIGTQTTSELATYRETIYFNVVTDSYASPSTVPTTTPILPPEDRNAPHLDPTFYLLPIAITVGLVVVAVVIHRRKKASKITEGDSPEK